MAVDYRRPCKTREIRDDYAAHVARGSVLPGLDFGCAVGDLALADADGTIIEVDENPNDARGMSIIIKHSDGWQSHYLHLSKIVVKRGQKVRQGEIVAQTGNTGVTSTGAHLHYAIKNRLGKCIDPAVILGKSKARRERAKVVPG